MRSPVGNRRGSRADFKIIISALMTHPHILVLLFLCFLALGRVLDLSPLCYISETLLWEFCTALSSGLYSRLLAMMLA
ncbi:hypothetical protein B0H10DRAFT_2009192 [Mycena sp. CBHHK59/15]|nr:hypothetical protein B0H10DRAFT_2009192 [Mycena sp. CBHHK59/15]